MDRSEAETAANGPLSLLKLRSDEEAVALRVNIKRFYFFFMTSVILNFVAPPRVRWILRPRHGFTQKVTIDVQKGRRVMKYSLTY